MVIKNLNRWIISAVVLIILMWIAWYFSSLIVYVVLSAVLSIMGHPIVRFLDKIRVGGLKIPHVVNTLITLIVIVVLIGFFVGIFVPLLARQATLISSIDIDAIANVFGGSMSSFDNMLREYNIMQPGESVSNMIEQEIKAIFTAINYSGLVNSAFSFTGSLFIGIFSVLFITFFMLRDEDLLYNTIMLVTPERYHEQTNNIVISVKWLLTRYFVGVCIELITMMTIISVGLSLLGVKNALLIGFFGGLMNVIPYLGPIIGAALGVMLAVTTNLSLGIYEGIPMLTLKVLGVFAIANLFDNMVLQPTVYSKSVKAHPLEIFMVIMMAGSIAGAIGMVLAIPAYTVIRIIAMEFLTRSRIVKKLTEKMATDFEELKSKEKLKESKQEDKRELD